MKNMVTTRALFCIAAAVLLLISMVFLLPGCGGGGGGNGSTMSGNIGSNGNGGDGGDGGDSDTLEQQKQAVMDDISSYYDTLPHSDPVADTKAIYDYIKGRSEFTWAGIEETTGIVVCAIYSDGEVLSIVQDYNSMTDQFSGQIQETADSVIERNLSPTTAKEPPAGPSIEDTSKMATSRGVTVPSINRVNLVGNFADDDSLTKEAGNLFVDLANMFLDKGYAANAIWPNTLDEYKNAADGAGVTVFLGHSTLASIDSKWQYGMVTRISGKTINNDLKEEIKNRRMARALITVNKKDKPDEWGLKSRWFITSAFVKKYWSFYAKGSLVWNNTCLSNSGFSSDFINACQEKGASVYLGWDNTAKAMESFESARYFFDTALGTNRIGKEYRIGELKNRPFSYSSVHYAMRNIKHKKYGTDLLLYQTHGPLPLVNTNLKMSIGTDGFLVPSIKNMEVKEGKLVIYGKFGEDTGTVTIESSPLTIDEWTDSKITCDLSDENKCGDVIVELSGHKSNVAQLTKWEVTFHCEEKYEYHDRETQEGEPRIFTDWSGDETINSDVKLIIRADVRAARSNPGEAPHSNSIVQKFLTKKFPEAVKEGEIIQLTVSGEVTEDQSAENGDPEYKKKWTHSYEPIGEGPIKFDGSDNDRANAFYFGGYVEHRENKPSILKTYLCAQSNNGIIKVNVNPREDGSPQGWTNVRTYSSDANPSSKYLDLELDESYNVKDFELDPRTFEITSYIKKTIKLKWSAAEAKKAPDDQNGER